VVRDLRIHKLSHPRPLEPRTSTPNTVGPGYPPRPSRIPTPAPTPAPQSAPVNRRDGGSTAPNGAATRNHPTVLTDADISMDDTD
jgi:hypothetical protein